MSESDKKFELLDANIDIIQNRFFVFALVRLNNKPCNSDQARFNVRAENKFFMLWKSFNNWEQVQCAIINLLIYDKVIQSRSPEIRLQRVTGKARPAVSAHKPRISVQVERPGTTSNPIIPHTATNELRHSNVIR